MGPLDKLALHVHGVLSGQTRSHSKVVVVFTVHHGRVHHAGAVRSGDPIRFQHRPGRG